MREIVGLCALVATGGSLPIWASSVVAFVLTFVLLLMRFRSDNQHRPRVPRTHH